MLVLECLVWKPTGADFDIGFVVNNNKRGKNHEEHTK